MTLSGHCRWTACRGSARSPPGVCTAWGRRPVRNCGSRVGRPCCARAAGWAAAPGGGPGAGVGTGGGLRVRRRQPPWRACGSFGGRRWALARGIDDRPLVVERVRQSVSVEHTYEQHLPDLAACIAALPPLLEKLAQRLG